MSDAMNPTDAANVAAFLVRQIESGHGSPEAIASLQRVVDYLNGLIKRLTEPVGDGGPAFPVLPPLGPDGTSAVGYPYVSAGLTTRDYLAAKAMQAMSGGIWPDANERPEIAKRAYALADEMLKARAAKATGDAS